MKLYHGTTDELPIKDFILPSNQTRVLRESFRNYNTGVVFLTSSLPSAEKYAKKAASKFGGNPVVYSCVPVGALPQEHNHEILCRKAVVTNVLIY